MGSQVYVKNVDLNHVGEPFLEITQTHSLSLSLSLYKYIWLHIFTDQI